MCIAEMRVPDKGNGTGYKIVRRTDKEDEFLPYYSFFLKNGTGGIITIYFKNNRELYRKVRTVYKIGREYRVRHKYQAVIQNGDFFVTKRYNAGVHLYLGNPLNRGGKFREMRDQIYKGTHALVEFKYSSAMYYDSYEGVIVARSVTPIAVVDITKGVE